MKKVKLISVLIASFLACLVNNLSVSAFSDVSQDDYNYRGIVYMQQNGYARGYPDGTYRPNQILNRAEFIKILISSTFESDYIDRCLSLNPAFNQTQAHFSDVTNDMWFGKYLCVAQANGIISGYHDGTFRPSKSIRFTEAAKMIILSFGYADENDNYGKWYTPYLRVLSEHKAIPGSVESMYKEITRADLAEIIYRLKVDIHPKWSQFFDDDTLIRPTELELNHHYTKTADAVYYNGLLLEEADGETFEMLDELFAKDKEHVFVYGEILSGGSLDLSSFETLGEGYAKDKNSVYYYSGRYTDIDPDSFKILNFRFSKDRKNVYYENTATTLREEENLHAGSIEVLKNSQGLYVKDENSVYYDETLIKDADAETFEAIDSQHAYDKNNSYYRSKVQNN